MDCLQSNRRLKTFKIAYIRLVGQINKKGCTYSWYNKRETNDIIYSLIDWAFGNDLWFMRYEKLEAFYHHPKCSDHSPIIIRTEVAKQKLPRPFRLLNVLLTQENFKLITIEKDTLIQLEKWTTIHEKVLRQKSRATWLAYGDSDTKFFHATLKARQTRNRISCTEHGIQLHEPALIQKEFIGFFKNLLGTTAAKMPCLDPTIDRSASGSERPPSDKAHGIDGFPTEFFKEYWHLIGKEVTRATMQFFQTSKLLKEVICTTVTLVPKVKKPHL
ncbi:uncharacterized protein [Nicotiana tomentosiformis]|uniref:uncharacterized protein n=1 Tax=Nicotiana tomentosiformis TaxID=4098 RepID=UPI00388C85EE